jgi:hypothetical protein
VLYQLSYAPRFASADSSGASGIISVVSKIGPAVLFSAITVGFAGIAVAGGSAGRWVIAVAAAALAAWMGSFAWAALRRIGR